MTSNNEAGFGAVIELTADVVSAYVSNNPVNAADLPQLMATIHAALSGLGAPAAEHEPEKPVPAVAIKKSITPDYLISLEDGRPYKALKRHLTGRGLTPADYRSRWGLPPDYPMVAPNYAKQRSELALALGLGQQRRKRPAVPLPAPSPAPAKRGRPKKT